MAADRKDWNTCGSFFTEEILLDHLTEVNPEKPQPEPQHAKTSEVMKTWEELFASFVSTQHMVTNHKVEVEGDTAVCESYVNAMHIAKASLNAERYHQAFGTYRHHLVRTEDRWLINKVHYKQQYALGNPAIFGVH